jgi:FADH2 O2-dependent halogenase
LTLGCEYDFVIFGAGFGGSIMAMILRQLGYSVLLLERGKHPRFTIGESSTPFANLLLETLAERYDLPFLRALSEWGSWQANHPQIGCGLKRGFTFYHHTTGRAVDFRDRSSQLLVAASPNDRVADTHWYRPEFDLFLVERARELGAIYCDDVVVLKCERSNAEWKIGGSHSEGSFEVKAGFAIDASGANGFLANHLNIPKIGFKSMPATMAVYAHFKDVARLDESDRALENPELPYPPDDAAVHHVFDGGWVWVLRLNNGITSAGAALLRENENGRSAEKIWGRLLARFPSLSQQFAKAKLVTPFYRSDALSFRRDRCAGGNWALLPSAAGFVDPLLSTGFALTLLGIQRLGEIFSDGLSPSEDALKEYCSRTLFELDAAADLISALYATMDRFGEFTLLSLLYFAAMTFSETAWRVGKRELASGFLLTNNAEFNSVRRHFCALARAGDMIHGDDIARALAPWEIAGLTDWTHNNWYPFRTLNLESFNRLIWAQLNESRDALRPR